MNIGFRVIINVAAVVAVATFGCSLPLKIGVINNTGEAVTILSATKTFTVTSGRVARFKYPSVDEWGRFRAIFGGCNFTYEVPGSIYVYARLKGFKNEVMTQLEKNGSLYLIPPFAIRAAALSDVEALQNEGFPVAPIERDCPKPLEP